MVTFFRLRPVDAQGGIEHFFARGLQRGLFVFVLISWVATPIQKQTTTCHFLCHLIPIMLKLHIFYRCLNSKQHALIASFCVKAAR